MNFIIALILSLCLIASVPAQKRKGVRSRKRASVPASGPPSAQSPLEAPRYLGTSVVIRLKDGNQIAGQLLELSEQGARIKSGETETTIALDVISSLSFAASPVALEQQSAAQQGVTLHQGVTARPRADFLRDVEAILNLLKAVADATRVGTSYTDYGNQLIELRRAVERFVVRYSASENNSETRAVALVAGALTDYTWARAIWTLKLGYSGTSKISESDSPIVADALRNYPDLRAAAAADDKLSADKLVSGLWKKAAEKTESLRRIIGSPR
jgi:hypothetical protein